MGPAEGGGPPQPVWGAEEPVTHTPPPFPHGPESHINGLKVIFTSAANVYGNSNLWNNHEFTQRPLLFLLYIISMTFQALPAEFPSEYLLMTPICSSVGADTLNELESEVVCYEQTVC